MPIGTSDGQYFESPLEYAINSARGATDKKMLDQQEMNANETSGDFQSRFGGAEQRPLVYIGMPPGASTEPAGALKPDEGSGTPENGYNTKLSLPEETKFTDWKSQYAPKDSGEDYDLRGAFKAGVQPDAETGHWPDTYKKPNHPTFSNQSQYSKYAPDKAGTWEGDKYIPPVVRPEPYGLNPPEGNAIQSYVKGIEDDLRNLPETFRNIPEEFRKNMEKSKAKTDDERLNEAINIVMSVGTGTMAGVKATTVKGKLVDLGYAQVLESNGHHPDTIWRSTGFGRGADGRWRHEIDDSKSVFNKNWADNPTPTEKQTGFKIRMLPEVLDHPELYKAYPQLKNVQVVYDHSYKGAAQWDGSAITVGKGYFQNHGVLMHEIQHAVQDIEGFAKGGAAGKAPTDYRLKYTKDVEALRPEYMDVLKKLDDPKAIWTTNEVERASYLHKVFKTNKEYEREANSEANRNYYKLSGETEARNTDTRLLLTEKERRNITPIATEDLPRAQQVSRDKPSEATAYGYRGAAAIQFNAIGDLWDKVFGKKEDKPDLPVTVRNDGYPTQKDALYAIQQGLGYGTSHESAVEGKQANVKDNVLLNDLRSMINSKGKSLDLTQFKNIDELNRINTMYAQGMLAANRSAIATLGFNPGKTDLTTDLGKLTVGGAFDPLTDKIWVNVEGDRKPSTVVHESIHRGIQKLREWSPEAKEILKNLPNEEYVVRYMMAKKMGNPESGTGNAADEQIKKAMDLFDVNPKYANEVEKLEEIAAELHKWKRPRGPR